MIERVAALVFGGKQFQTAEWFAKETNAPIYIQGNTYSRFQPVARSVADAFVGFQYQPGINRLHTMGSTNNTVLNGPIVNRIERVVDPDNAGKVCWLLQAHRDDPDTTSAGAKRAEFSFLPNIKEHVDYVLGWKVRLADYVNQMDQFLVIQIHGLDGTGSPFFALYVKPAGLVLSVRGPDGVELSQNTQAEWPANTWIKYVAALRMSPAGGYMRAWRNDQEIANYVGPFGYDQIAGSYLKSGIYQWSTSNPWDNNYPMKTCWMKGPYLVESTDVAGMSVFLDTL